MYKRQFQKRMVPELEEQSVVSLDRADSGFRIQLQDGEVLFAKRVVIAAGISHFQYMPQELRGLPRELVTHSSQHTALGKFKGKDVTVMGAGASAIDLAAVSYTHLDVYKRQP